MRKYQHLPTEDTLDVLVTRRFFPDEKQPYYIWSFIPWPLTESPRYRQLLSTYNLPLYPGEHREVAGKSMYVVSEGLPSLFIDKVRKEIDFVIKEDQKVRLLYPRRARQRSATFANWIISNVNGEEVELRIPIVAFGKIVEDKSTPAVRINRIDRPQDDKEYLLHAEFV